MLRMVKLIIISTKAFILHVLLVPVFTKIRNTKHLVYTYLSSVGQHYFIFSPTKVKTDYSVSISAGKKNKKIQKQTKKTPKKQSWNATVKFMSELLNSSCIYEALYQWQMEPSTYIRVYREWNRLKTIWDLK